jgi:anti-anti-sigma factor
MSLVRDTAEQKTLYIGAMTFQSSTLPDGLLLIALVGRLDIEGAQAIDRPFSFATTVQAARVVLDLSGVTFLASIGIRLLMTTARAQALRGGKVALAAPQPLVRKVLEMAGIDQLVPIVEDLEAARVALS